MAVITITISESPIQLVSGIPQYVSLEANIPSTIFYTLDGTEPTIDSDIYIEPIKIPTLNATAVLKIYATNGVDSSVIITQEYFPVLSGRNPRDKVIGLRAIPGTPNPNIGYNSPNPDVMYGNIGGITVDDPTLTEYPDGYDGTATGTHADFTNEPITPTASYEIKYSLSNSKGERGPLIGNLPAQVRPIIEPKVNNSPYVNSELFNPSAMVIISDSTQEFDDPDHPVIMREQFSLMNTEKARDGSMFNTSAFEGNGITGSMLLPHYNPRDNTYTFYYRDSESNRWIISKEVMPRSTNAVSYSNLLFPPSKPGSRYVIPWSPFKYSIR